jgi:hypothetical protein
VREIAAALADWGSRTPLLPRDVTRVAAGRVRQPSRPDVGALRPDVVRPSAGAIAGGIRHWISSAALSLEGIGDHTPSTVRGRRVYNEGTTLPMHIVRTATRPARLALLMSPEAGARVWRRALRLVGGRWGGVFDVLAVVNSDGTIDDVNAAFLRTADCDWVFSIDPRLDRVDLRSLVSELRLQPFAVTRLRERAERDERSLRWLFAEDPTRNLFGAEHGDVADYDSATVSLREAFEHGFPSTTSRRVRVRSGGRGVATPVELSRRFLRSRAGRGRWLLFGDENELPNAVAYWSLRALGARPMWQPTAALEADAPPPRALGRLWLYGPTVDPERVREAAARWATNGRVRPIGSNPGLALSRGGAYFASHVQPVGAHRGLLRFSLPAPPLTDEPLRGVLRGVAEHEFQSADPDAPDGIVLARTPASRHLFTAGDPDGEPIRITTGGVAEARSIARPTLVVLPSVSYRDAVAAPFTDAGFNVATSDKGRFQQRSLELARGLRFLAWCLRQRDSSRLLDLFFEHHLSAAPAADYRRAVTLADLEARLHAGLRQSRTRLRAPLRAQAHTWLMAWTRALLERGLLVAGYVLACTECAYRAWYRADDVGQRFICERCTATSPIVADAVRSFRLNEAFWQLRHHNGEVVTLLLANLRDGARRSLLYLPEVQLTAAGMRDGEADVAALVDGDLLLAEAKSNNELSNAEVGWYRTVAARTRARRLIFATTARTKPLCAALDCEACASSHGEHHRDYAWSDASRARVDSTRERLAGRGVSVTTACYRTLVADHDDASAELFPMPESPWQV